MGIRNEWDRKHALAGYKAMRKFYAATRKASLAAQDAFKASTYLEEGVGAQLIHGETWLQRMLSSTKAANLASKDIEKFASGLDTLEKFCKHHGSKSNGRPEQPRHQKTHPPSAN